MNSTIIILLVISAIVVVLVGAFWAVDKISKGEMKASTPKREKTSPQPPKEEPPVPDALAPTPPPAEDTATANPEKKDDERQAERTRQKQRYTIMNYHRDKWNPTSDTFDFEGDQQRRPTDLSDEDLRKIMTLKDLFERKTDDPNTNK